MKSMDITPRRSSAYTRRPALRALVDLLALQPQHARDAGATDVNVQQTDLRDTAASVLGEKTRGLWQ